MNKIKLLGMNILFKPLKDSSVLETGSKMCVGEILELGHILQKLDIPIKIGDKIMFLEHGAWTIKNGTEEYNFVPYDDKVIMCFYE